MVVGFGEFGLDAGAFGPELFDARGQLFDRPVGIAEEVDALLLGEADLLQLRFQLGPDLCDGLVEVGLRLLDDRPDLCRLCRADGDGGPVGGDGEFDLVQR